LSDSILWTRNLVCLESKVEAIQPGDRLIEVGGKKVKNLKELNKELSLYEEGEGVVYRILKSSGKASLQFILLKKRTVPFSYILFSIVGFLSLALAVFLFFRVGVESIKNRFLVLSTLLFSVYVFSPLNVGTLTDYLFFIFKSASLWFFAPYFLYFFSLFPHRVEFKWKRTLIFGLPGVMFLFQMLLFALQTYLPFSILYGLTKALTTIQYILIGIYLSLSVLLLLYLLFTIEDEDERAQIKWILSGIGLAFIPFFIFYIIPYLNGYPIGPLGELSAAFHIFLPMAFLTSLTKFRLPDVDVILKKGLAFTISFLVVLSLFLVFAISFLPREKRGIAVILLAGAIFIAVLLFPVLYERINDLMDRVFYKKSFVYRTQLIDIAREIAAEKEWHKIERKLSETIAKALSAKAIAIYGFDGKEYQLIGKMGKTSPPAKMNIPSLVPGFVKIWRFKRQERDLGFLLLGPKEKGKYYNIEDFELLNFISPYITLALENSLLYMSLRRRAQELEELKDFNESIIESLPISLIITDGSGRVLKMNNEALRSFSPQEAKSLCSKFLPLEDGKANEMWITNSKGEKRLYSILKTSFKKAKGYIFAIEDVTESFMLQQRLITSEKLASLGVLIAGIAHEINTPITGIMSYIEMLSDELKGQQTEYIEKIQAQIKRILKTVRSLLNFSRRAQEGVVRANLVDIIRDVAEVLNPQIRKKRVEVKIEGKGWARVNPDRMQQVFFNLFTNALEAVEEGVGKIEIKTWEENGVVKISFSDNGKGIPQEYLSKIFDPFFSTRPGGTGLGLSITFAIIKEHRGEIEVLSEKGRGTTFIITLPSWRSDA